MRHSWTRGGVFFFLETLLYFSDCRVELGVPVPAAVPGPAAHRTRHSRPGSAPTAPFVVPVCLGRKKCQLLPNRIYRIFVVGGSTIFGSGVTTDEKTIPGFLQQEFDKSGKNVEVINVGIGAAWSFSEKFLIENYIQNYEPDLVVVYDGANVAIRDGYIFGYCRL